MSTTARGRGYPPHQVCQQRQTGPRSRPTSTSPARSKFIAGRRLRPAPRSRRPELLPRRLRPAEVALRRPRCADRAGARRRSRGPLAVRRGRRGTGLSLVDRDRARRRQPTTKGAQAGGATGWRSLGGLHTLRHTCATTLFHRGVNPKQAQVWLGHHSPPFTLAVYTHLLSGDLPDVDLLGVATPRQPAPPRRAETGTALRGRKRAWRLGLARPSWKYRASFNPKVAGSIPARPT